MTYENHTPARRRILHMTMMFPFFSSCKAAPMTVVLDVVLFNYLDRAIFDVFIDGKAAALSTPYPHTGGGTISGVRLQLGPKTVTWRLGGPEGMPRNGETVAAKNRLELTSLPPNAEFLAVHIYPGDIVELIPSVHYPQETEKGVAMSMKAKRR
ncbi:hypothetical protein [Massilia sp. KIM]|uniref:hypothetical protein n=1 Tax=Massilia sp. KIM TaxID=1955422 RepID=UPI00117EB4FA|nr:hypothetical protein [Massilia sp. KIM]